MKFRKKKCTHARTDIWRFRYRFYVDSDGRLKTELYDKREDFNIPIVNFPFVCNNIQITPAHRIYISQLIRYSTACDFYNNFLVIELARELLNQCSLWLS